MPKTMEFTAKNVEKALEMAGKKLNLAPNKIKHDVLSYGSSGIFGLVGVKKAKIRVILENKTGNEIQNVEENLADLKPREHAKNLVKAAFQIEDEPEEIKKDDFANGRNGFEAEEEISQEIIDYGKEVVETIVKAISEEARISVKRENNRIIYNVEGGKNAVLIGKRGHTLEAIQYLVEKIVNKKNEKRLRIFVDVEGYLKTRRENLQKLASRTAQKAKRAGKPMTLGQMNSHDRRIVHLFLKKDNGVRTQSIGEGYYRRLMVFPKKRKRGKR